MAKKTYLGIDIGQDRLKLALVKGSRIKKMVSVPMPEMLLKEGRVVSIEAMGELIRDTARSNHMSCRNAALVLNGEQIFVKNVTMPQMSPEQLIYNLPYEFRDYISDDLRNYLFDYAMVSTVEEMLDPGKETSDMELLAVAISREIMDDYRLMLRKAGMKLAKAAPLLCSYAALIRQLEAAAGNPGKEYAILDIGHTAIRLDIFKGDCHSVSRTLESGMSRLDEAVSSTYNVDIHAAHNYLITNFDNCQEKEVCIEQMMAISVELMRAVNFYQFSNPASQLEDLWICGGGAAIPAFQRQLQEVLNMQLHGPRELLPGVESLAESDDLYLMIPAIGITMS